MQDNINIITLLAIVVAVFVILRLRTVLGRHTDEDEARVTRKVRTRKKHTSVASDKIVTLPQPDTRNRLNPENKEHPEEDLRNKIRALGITDAIVGDGLVNISKHDNNFDVEHFRAGAKQAYEIIVTAFAEGNRNTLRDLLSEDVFKDFEMAIANRENRNEKIDQSFVGINHADIIEADLRENEAYITVKFVSQLISSTRNNSGEVINGDPQSVVNVTDIWTFSRDIISQNPNWRLISTHSMA
ncbi:MAG: Tim44 domain-containing protein [Hyphomicrobiaceae bacterium]|nr:Tim44 domain-containing protein [Hyphomicrobiaceae bacterium]